MIRVFSDLECDGGAIIIRGYKCYYTLDAFKEELLDYVRNLVGDISFDLVEGDEGGTFITEDIDDLWLPLRYTIHFSDHCANMYYVEQLLECFSFIVHEDVEPPKNTIWGYWLLDLDIM